jgi:hypothetical protein
VENLDHYIQPFKAVVLKHLTSLPPVEWERLRSLSVDKSRYADSNHVGDPAATPGALVDAATSTDFISVNDVIKPWPLKAAPIDVIADQPVYYVDGEGIYVWGLDQQDSLSLQVWVTHPAYPPSW